MYEYVMQSMEENAKIKDLPTNSLVKMLNATLRNNKFILLSTLL